MTQPLATLPVYTEDELRILQRALSYYRRAMCNEVAGQLCRRLTSQDKPADPVVEEKPAGRLGTCNPA